MLNMMDYMDAGVQDGEIIVDLFAGGGGASEGIRMATGRDPEAAVNHNAVAVSMHKANHPGTVHHIEDIWTVSPTHVTLGRPVGLLWASPDCTHFSKAKGGAPKRDDKIRSLALVLTDKWIPAVHPRVLIMENVEEFTTWGPLDCKGRVIEAAKGDTFRMFINRLRRLGYKVQWRELRACDYGAPTIRKRLFLVARRDGLPIVWPAPTHGDPMSEDVLAGKLKPWRTAAECIDWSLPCPSIFATAAEIWEEYGLRAKRPLAENTLKRIAEGVRRYVLEHPEPFTVTYYGPKGENDFRGGGMGDPLGTQTTENRHALVTPVISTPSHSKTTGRSKYVWAPGEPLRTVTSGGGFSMVAPYLVKANHGYKYFRGNSLDEPMRTATASQPGFAIAAPLLTEHANGSRQRTFDAAAPLRTQCAQVKGGHFALVAPAMVKNNTNNAPSNPLGPLATVTSGGRHIACSAFLAKHFTGVVGAPLNTPTPTVTTRDHNAVVAATMALYCGQSVAQDVGDPARTVTGRERHGLVTAHIERQFTQSSGNDVSAPLGATTAGGGGKSALVASSLVKMRGDNIGQDNREPLRTISSQGLHHAEARAFLMKYYSEGGQHQDMRDPAHTTTTKARLGLVTIKGEEYEIVDIGMRMLSPRELFRAQGFEDTYIIDHGADGEPLTKAQQVRMCGNSVCPPMAAALVYANCADIARAETEAVA